MTPLIECVPNFSEGNDTSVIRRIADAIRSVQDVQLLHIDPGKAANRTVMTFVGEPEPVCEAAFRAVKAAAHLIDMSKHRGEHPRIGATDVLPLVPIRAIDMDTTVALAHRLGQRIGKQLGIPGYFYEYAATQTHRRSLAACRAGQYEALPQTLADPNRQPDFGPNTFNPSVRKTGATIVGARRLLIAYNVNLNTSSAEWAHLIASEVREKGAPIRQGHPIDSPPMKDDKGKIRYKPGLLKAVKGLGWYIQEYGKAQLSFNLTDIDQTPLHKLFETACERAEAYGIRVTGSELVGMIPLQPLLDAGYHFLRKNGKNTDVPHHQAIDAAVQALGLDELAPFHPQHKIIEYRAGLLPSPPTDACKAP